MAAGVAADAGQNSRLEKLGLTDDLKWITLSLYRQGMILE
jgi:hypothetical protein